MEELTRIADALEQIADKLDMLAETGAEIEQDLDTLAECTGYIAPPVYAPAEAKGAHYFRIGGSVDAGQQEGEKAMNLRKEMLEYMYSSMSEDKGVHDEVNEASSKAEKNRMRWN